MKETKPSYAIVWQFDVKPGAEPEFEKVYGPKGDWARLFGRAEGYIGTELLRDTQHAHRYLTIDRWRSLEDFVHFRQAHGAEYADLDRRCEAWNANETAVGNWIVIEG
jgi:heme-degrading monooxygenase HmoA